MAPVVVLVVTTFNLASGLIVPIPTFSPVWKIAESPSAFVLVQSGMKSVVPEPVIWAQVIELESKEVQNKSAKQVFLIFIVRLLKLAAFYSPLGAAPR